MKTNKYLSIVFIVFLSIYYTGCTEKNGGNLYTYCHLVNFKIATYDNPNADSVFMNNGYLSGLTDSSVVSYKNLYLSLGGELGNCSESINGQKSTLSGMNKEENLYRLFADTLLNIEIISNHDYDKDHKAGAILNDMLLIKRSGYISEDDNGEKIDFPLSISSFIQKSPVGFGWFGFILLIPPDAADYHTFSITYTDSYGKTKIKCPTLFITP